MVSKQWREAMWRTPPKAPALIYCQEHRWLALLWSQFVFFYQPVWHITSNHLWFSALFSAHQSLLEGSKTFLGMCFKIQLLWLEYQNFSYITSIKHKLWCGWLALWNSWIKYMPVKAIWTMETLYSAAQMHNRARLLSRGVCSSYLWRLISDGQQQHVETHSKWEDPPLILSPPKIDAENLPRRHSSKPKWERCLVQQHSRLATHSIAMLTTKWLLARGRGFMR